MALQLCAVDSVVVTAALNAGLKDFEDGIQLACASLNGLDAIATRDLKDFSGTNFPVLAIAGLLAHL
jgi:hypothetical protein